jgi:hypothetical protein
MRKPRGLLAAAMIGLIVVPIGALANHGGTCGYTSTQENKLGQNGITVYADTNGNSGTSGSADQAVGVCSDAGDGVGGSLEAGHSSQYGTTYGLMPGLREGGYLVADGGSGNPDPGDGYIGLSNFERKKENCTPSSSNPGSPPWCSTNSGGRFGAGGGPYAPVMVPLLICGNSTGPQWDETNRDGCEVP